MNKRAVVLIFLVFSLSVNGQKLLRTYFQSKFDNIFHSANGISRVKNLARSGNVNNFLAISYYIDGNNLSYKRTGEEKYLEINEDIIDIIIKKSKKEMSGEGNIWVAKISERDINHLMDKKEFMLYEGYFFRYVSEFVFLNQKSKNNWKYIEFLEDNFLKWRNRSISKYKDNSFFHGARLHMGSHWATVGLFLTKIESVAFQTKNISKELVEEYDYIVKHNLIKKKFNNQSEEIFTWNSTYNVLFTNYLKSDNYKSWNKKDEVQDISHGNHIVQYILHSYEYGFNKFSLDDIKILCNTLKLVLWNKKEKEFYSLLSGSHTSNSILRKANWKVIDGWFKLSKYDHTIYSLMLTFYIKNNNKIDKSIYNYQFYNLMLSYDSN